MLVNFFNELCNILGLGKAAQIASEDMEFDKQHVQELKDYFVKKLSEIPRLYLNGHESQSYPGIINMSFEYIEGEALMMAIKNVAVSSGSACTSASLEPSYVLRALGVGEDLAHTSIRFSIG